MELAERILAKLDQAFEQEYYSFVDVDDLASELGVSRQQISLAVAPLISDGVVEESTLTLEGRYDLRLTAFGKERLDEASGNRVNVRIREKLLAAIAKDYQDDVYTLFESDELGGRLGIEWNTVCLNLVVLEAGGLVELEKPTRGAEHIKLYGKLTREGYTAHKYPAAAIVFLSHASADATIAGYLKQVIEASFPKVHVFVSTDCEDIGLGKAWAEKVLQNLHDAQMLLILASKRAMERKWVWYETGSAWGAGLDPIPCCVGDIRFEDLPLPFTGFQGTQLGTAAGIKKLFDELGQHYEIEGSEPDYGELAGTIKALDKEVQEIGPAGIGDWVGVEWNRTWIVYTGPLEVLEEIADEPHDPRLLPVLAEHFVCRWAKRSNVSAHKGKGYAVAYQTDRKKWKRRLTNDDCVLMLKPKAE